MTPTERGLTTAVLIDMARTRAVVVEHDLEFVRRLECPVTVPHEGSVPAKSILNHGTGIW